MRLFRSARWLLLAMLICVIPATSHAGVFISVNFGPPVLPVYVQPVCPQPGLMWTPGYWGYGPDGYYWVPGAWVPAPYAGALWTPGYWGWSNGLYVFNPGYWGLHVGYYGGINYGFGYGGIGFAGGMWRGGVFAYNTAVMHVGVGFHSVYVDRAAIDRGFVARDSHVAFSGGPGGINHPANAEERAFAHEAHTPATSFQTQHESAARGDRTAYARNNGGHPANLAASRPLAAESHPAPAASRAAAPMAANRTAPAAGAPRANPSFAPRSSNAAVPRTATAPRTNAAPSRAAAAPRAAPRPAAKPKPEGHEK
jgi:hypothetical protein